MYLDACHLFFFSWLFYYHDFPAFLSILYLAFICDQPLSVHGYYLQDDTLKRANFCLLTPSVKAAEFPKHAANILPNV